MQRKTQAHSFLRTTAFGVLALLASATASRAESPTGGFGDLEAGAVRHLSDGAWERDTVDPFGHPVTVVGEPRLENPIDHPWDDPKSDLFRGLEVDEADKFQGFWPGGPTWTTLDVYIFVDEEYRAKHPDWILRTYNIVETADNAFFRDFGINWVVQNFIPWKSDGSTSEEILVDLATDGASLPDGLVIGFTRDEGFTAGGIAYVYENDPGTGFSVNWDQGMTSTTSAVRHEIGHNYGLGHDSDPTVCLMNYTYAYEIDYFDAHHEEDIESHESWFN